MRGLAAAAAEQQDQAGREGEEAEAEHDEIGLGHEPKFAGRYSSRPEPWIATIRPTIIRMTAPWLPWRGSSSAAAPVEPRPAEDQRGGDGELDDAVGGHRLIQSG